MCKKSLTVIKDVRKTVLLDIFTSYGLLRGVEWVHGLFLFPLVLGKM